MSSSLFTSSRSLSTISSILVFILLATSIVTIAYGKTRQGTNGNGQSQANSNSNVR
jgi:hypothetical protein